MRQRTEEEERIAKYLLGDVDDAERDRVGERSVVDDDFAELVDSVAMDLMEAYVQNRLPADERARFESYFPITRHGEKQMVILACLAAEQKRLANKPQLAEESKRSGLAWMILTPRLRLTFAVAATLVIGIQGWLLLSLWPKRYAPPVTTGTLAPQIALLTGRGEGVPTTLQVNRGTSYVCFALAVPADDQSSDFRIEVLKDHKALFRQDKTLPSTFAAHTVIVALIPSQLFRDGEEYTIAWQGYSPTSETQSYRIVAKLQ